MHRVAAQTCPPTPYPENVDSEFSFVGFAWVALFVEYGSSAVAIKTNNIIASSVNKTLLQTPPASSRRGPGDGPTPTRRRLEATQPGPLTSPPTRACTQSASKSERERGRRAHLEKDREKDRARKRETARTSDTFSFTCTKRVRVRGREREGKGAGGRKGEREGGSEGMREGGEGGAEMLAQSHTQVHEYRVYMCTYTYACTHAHERTLYLSMTPPRVTVDRYERGDVSTPG